MTAEQYVRIALELAGDLPRLSQLRATLRDRMQGSPLMDAHGLPAMSKLPIVTCGGAGVSTRPEMPGHRACVRIVLGCNLRVRFACACRKGSKRMALKIFKSRLWTIRNRTCTIMGRTQQFGATCQVPLCISLGDSIMKTVRSALFVLAVLSAGALHAQETGSLGVTMSDNRPGGTLITSVLAGSPASKIGLQAGDRILTIDGQKTDNYRDVLRVIGTHKPGDKIELVIIRGAWKTKLTAKLGAKDAVFTATPKTVAHFQADSHRRRSELWPSGLVRA